MQSLSIRRESEWEPQPEQQEAAFTDTLLCNLQEAARKAWWQPGHPGWCIPWDYDSTAFMRSLTEAPNVAQPAPSPKMRISAPVPRTLQTSKIYHLHAVVMPVVRVTPAQYAPTPSVHPCQLCTPVKSALRQVAVAGLLFVCAVAANCTLCQLCTFGCCYMTPPSHNYSSHAPIGSPRQVLAVPTHTFRTLVV